MLFSNCLFRSHEVDDQRRAEIATAGAALKGVFASLFRNDRIATWCSNAYTENNGRMDTLVRIAAVKWR
jgi:hypothetical protein